MANFMMGSPSRFEKIPKLRPQQESGINQVLQMALSQLQGGVGDFAPIAKQAEQRYFGDILPSIAERFTSMGAQRSGGFQEARERSGTELATNLAALQSQHGLQRQGLAQQLLGLGLQPQDEIGYFGGRTGLLGSMGPGIGEGVGGFLKALPSLIGTGIGAAYGGPAGAAAGGAGGEGVSKLIQLLMSLMQGSGQGGSEGGVSMDPSQNPVLGSNII